MYTVCSPLLCFTLSIFHSLSRTKFTMHEQEAQRTPLVNLLRLLTVHASAVLRLLSWVCICSIRTFCSRYNPHSPSPFLNYFLFLSYTIPRLSLPFFQTKKEMWALYQRIYEGIHSVILNVEGWYLHK